uniref:Astacin domain-containing protein n=1 Tax=Steinernema glaseri TaxID=37863 RepID=A0A1I8APE6_9BILA
MDFHRFLVSCLALFLTINQCNVGAQNPVAPVDPAAATTVAVPSVPPVDPSVTQTTTTASVVSSDTPTVPASTPITTTLGSQVPSVSPGPMPPATVDQSGTTVASVPLQTSTPVTTTIPATSPMNLSSILPITLTTNLPQPVVSIAPGIVPSTPPHPVTPPQTAEERLTALENNIPKTADGIEIKGKNLIIKTGSRLFAYKGGRPNMTAEIEQIAKVLADSNQRKTQALNPKPLPAGAPLNYQQINAVYKFSEVIVEGDISVTLKDAKTRVPPPPPVVATLAQIVSTRVNMTASSPPPPTTPPAPRARRQALYDTNYPSDIWTNGVYYSFDSKLSANARRVIQQAMSFWQANTCVRFIQTNPNGSTSYPVIVFISGEGCYSPVGRKTDVQIQYVSIGPQCETVGIDLLAYYSCVLMLFVL